MNGPPPPPPLSILPTHRGYWCITTLKIQRGYLKMCPNTELHIGQFCPPTHVVPGTKCQPTLPWRDPLISCHIPVPTDACLTNELGCKCGDKSFGVPSTAKRRRSGHIHRSKHWPWMVLTHSLCLHYLCSVRHGSKMLLQSLTWPHICLNVDQTVLSRLLWYVVYTYRFLQNTILRLFRCPA